MNVGDLLVLPRPNGRKAMWKVDAVLLGEENQESVYALKPVDLDPATDEWGLRVQTMYVPVVLVEAAGAKVVVPT